MKRILLSFLFIFTVIVMCDAQVLRVDGNEVPTVNAATPNIGILQHIKSCNGSTMVNVPQTFKVAVYESDPKSLRYEWSLPGANPSSYRIETNVNYPGEAWITFNTTGSYYVYLRVYFPNDNSGTGTSINTSISNYCP